MLAAGVGVAALAACQPPAEDWMSGQQQPPAAIASAQAMPGVLPPLPTSLPGGQLTPVGQRAQQLKQQADALQSRVEARAQELQQARANAIDLSQRYYSTTAGINARLQVGTTPGNPILRQQWVQASQELDRMAAEVGRMSAAQAGVQQDASQAAFLLEQVRAAYSVQGAVDDDHRLLRQVEDQTNRTVVTIDRIQGELSEDVRRQTAYVAQERSNLNLLQAAVTAGALTGPSLANRPVAMVGQQQGAGGVPGGLPAMSGGGGGSRPLVTIRFDRPNPAYEQPLYTAISRAMERRPGATFEVVGVSPPNDPLAAQAARRQAEQVARSMGALGVSADRVRVMQGTSPTVASNEVQLFVY
jgi:hypothetical protein